MLERLLLVRSIVPYSPFHGARPKLRAKEDLLTGLSPHNPKGEIPDVLESFHLSYSRFYDISKTLTLSVPILIT